MKQAQMAPGNRGQGDSPSGVSQLPARRWWRQKRDGDQLLIFPLCRKNSLFEDGISLAESKNYSAARQNFLLVLSKSQKFAKAHYHLGSCEGKLGNAQAAKEHLELAIALGFKEPRAHFNLGLALFLADDFKGAADEFSRAINKASLRVLSKPPFPNTPSRKAGCGQETDLKILQLAHLNRAISYIRLAEPHAAKHYEALEASGAKIGRKGTDETFHSHFYCWLALDDLKIASNGAWWPISQETSDNIRSLKMHICDIAVGLDSRRAENARGQEITRRRNLF